jgi:hypothetical protein
VTATPRLTQSAIEVLDLMERNIDGAEHEGALTVELSTVAARIMLDLARQAPRPNTGQRKPRREKIRESVIYSLANREQIELTKKGMRKAAARAAAVAMAKRELPHLNERTIADRMSAHSSRRRKPKTP